MNWNNVVTFIRNNWLPIAFAVVGLLTAVVMVPWIMTASLLGLPLGQTALVVLLVLLYNVGIITVYKVPIFSNRVGHVLIHIEVVVVVGWFLPKFFWLQGYQLEQGWFYTAFSMVLWPTLLATACGLFASLVIQASPKALWAVPIVCSIAGGGFQAWQAARAPATRSPFPEWMTGISPREIIVAFCPGNAKIEPDTSLSEWSLAVGDDTEVVSCEALPHFVGTAAVGEGCFYHGGVHTDAIIHYDEDEKDHRLFMELLEQAGIQLGDSDEARCQKWNAWRAQQNHAAAGVPTEGTTSIVEQLQQLAAGGGTLGYNFGGTTSTTSTLPMGGSSMFTDFEATPYSWDWAPYFGGGFLVVGLIVFGLSGRQRWSFGSLSMAAFFGSLGGIVVVEVVAVMGPRGSLEGLYVGHVQHVRLNIPPHTCENLGWLNVSTQVTPDSGQSTPGTWGVGFCGMPQSAGQPILLSVTTGGKAPKVVVSSQTGHQGLFPGQVYVPPSEYRKREAPLILCNEGGAYGELVVGSLGEMAKGACTLSVAGQGVPEASAVAVTARKYLGWSTTPTHAPAPAPMPTPAPAPPGPAPSARPAP